MIPPLPPKDPSYSKVDAGKLPELGWSSHRSLKKLMEFHFRSFYLQNYEWIFPKKREKGVAQIVLEKKNNIYLEKNSVVQLVNHKI